MFNSVVQIYQDALNNAGYTHVLKYTPEVANENENKKKVKYSLFQPTLQ